jgi:hypothetical protein
MTVQVKTQTGVISRESPKGELPRVLLVEDDSQSGTLSFPGSYEMGLICGRRRMVAPQWTSAILGSRFKHLLTVRGLPQQNLEPFKKETKK